MLTSLSVLPPFLPSSSHIFFLLSIIYHLSSFIFHLSLINLIFIFTCPEYLDKTTNKMRGNNMNMWLNTLDAIKTPEKYNMQDHLANTLKEQYDKNSKSPSASWSRWVDKQSVQMMDIPVLLFLSGKQQECLNCIMHHRWCTDSFGHGGFGAPCRYSVPYSNAGVDVDPFGPVDPYLWALEAVPPCADAEEDDHILRLIYGATLALIKIAVLVDMIRLRDLDTMMAQHTNNMPQEIVDMIQSSLVYSPLITPNILRQWRSKQLDPVLLVDRLTGQIKALILAVSQVNPHFWSLFWVILAVMTHTGDPTDSTLLENNGILDDIDHRVAGAKDDESTEYGKSMFNAFEAGLRIALIWYYTPCAVIVLDEMIDFTKFLRN